MRTTLMLLAFYLAAPAFARDDGAQQHAHEIVFGAASQLLAWCEGEARAHFGGLGITTYQWTGRHFERGNTLHAEGKLRADGKDVPVTCQASRGARERDATIRID